MAQKMYGVTAAALLVLLPACSWFGSKTEEATPAAASAPVVRVVNVLDDKLYADAHIKGSVHVDYDKIKDAAAAWDKNDTVVVYCANYQCKASGEAARQLQEMGFVNAKAYEGGMAEWYQLNKAGDASYAFEGPAQESYLATVVEPAAPEAGVVVINAADLKELMTSAQLL